jgi:hypothetical protein
MVETAGLLHTQEVRGSSPCAPTIYFTGAYAAFEHPKTRLLGTDLLLFLRIKWSVPKVTAGSEPSQTKCQWRKSPL